MDSKLKRAKTVYLSAQDRILFGLSGILLLIIILIFVANFRHISLWIPNFLNVPFLICLLLAIFNKVVFKTSVYVVFTCFVIITARFAAENFTWYDVLAILSSGVLSYFIFEAILKYLGRKGIVNK